MPKEKKPKHVEVDYRPLILNEAELNLLLLLSKKVTFPSGLLERMKELKYRFGDEVLKLKEMIARAKGNSFWLDNHQKLSEEDRQSLKEIAHIPASKLRAMLAKEQKNGQKLQARNGQKSHKPSRG